MNAAAIKKKLWNGLTFLMFALVVAGGTSMTTWTYLSRGSSPMEIHSVRVNPVSVLPGQEALVIYSMSKREACQVDIDGFWVRDDGSAAVRLPRVKGGYSPVDPLPHDVNVRMRIPTQDDHGGSVVGRLGYRSISMLYCPSGTYSVITPDAWFVVSAS